MAKAPLESFQVRVAAGKGQFGKIDLSVWEGKEKEGRALPSSISMRFQDLPKGVGYLTSGEALELSSMLQHYAVQVMRLDTERRLLAWREKQDAEFL